MVQSVRINFHVFAFSFKVSVGRHTVQFYKFLAHICWSHCLETGFGDWQRDWNFVSSGMDVVGDEVLVEKVIVVKVCFFGTILTLLDQQMHY